MRMLSDTEIYELIDHMDADGAITRFTVDRAEVHRVVVDAIGRELAAHETEATAHQLDVINAAELGAEEAALRSAIGALKRSLVDEAKYENKRVVDMLLEHPLYIRIEARLAEIAIALRALV